MTLRRRRPVLAHGAWHGAWAWHRLAPLLRRAGHTVSTPRCLAWASAPTTPLAAALLALG